MYWIEYKSFGLFDKSFLNRAALCRSYETVLTFEVSSPDTTSTSMKDMSLRKHVPSGFYFHSFTLVEVLLAMTISSLLVVTLVGATRTLSDARDRVQRRSDRLLEARHAMSAIVCAMQNVRRDPVSGERIIIGERGDKSGNDRINILVVSDRTARPDSQETDQYETSFFLMKHTGGNFSDLVCRKDHALDDHPQEGGLATVVAEGIIGLSFEYYTGSQWQNEWTELESQPPVAIKITICATDTTENIKPNVPPDVIELSTIVAININPAVAQPTQSAEASNQNQNSGGTRR